MLPLQVVAPDLANYWTDPLYIATVHGVAYFSQKLLTVVIPMQSALNTLPLGGASVHFPDKRIWHYEHPFT